MTHHAFQRNKIFLVTDYLLRSHHQKDKIYHSIFIHSYHSLLITRLQNIICQPPKLPPTPACQYKNPAASVKPWYPSLRAKFPTFYSFFRNSQGSFLYGTKCECKTTQFRGRKSEAGTVTSIFRRQITVDPSHDRRPHNNMYNIDCLQSFTPADSSDSDGDVAIFCLFTATISSIF